MKIAIIGSSSLLGEGFIHVSKKFNHQFIYTYFKKKNSPVNLFLDIRNSDKVMDFLEHTKPDIVINTAALTNPEKCAEKPEYAEQTNILGTQNLVKGCKKFDSHFIQISTEYVFDGKLGNYFEKDSANPISLYGKTKLESEKVTMENNPEFCVSRTAMLFGWSKNKLNLATCVINKLRNKQKIKVISDQIVSPSYNDNVAEMLIEIAEKRLKGVFHVAGASIVSRFEFAKSLAKIFELDDSLIEKILISDFEWKERRPLNGGLNVNKISRILKTKPLTLEKSLLQMKNNETKMQIYT